MTTCQHCQQTFSRTNSLTCHLQEKHSQNQTRIECGMCTKTFSHAEHYLHHHQAQQHNQALTSPTYPCPVCPSKTFKCLDHIQQNLQSCPALKTVTVAFVELKKNQANQETEPLKLTIFIQGAEFGARIWSGKQLTPIHFLVTSHVLKLS